MTTIPEAPDDLATATAECDRLRAFALAVLEGWPDSSADGFEIQDLAIKHGLLTLRAPAPTKPCKEEGCFCAEYHGTDFNGEFDEPVECYVRTPLLLDPSAEPTGAREVLQPSHHNLCTCSPTKRGQFVGGWMCRVHGQQY